MICRKGNVRIVNDLVEKEENDEIVNIYNYLKSRKFENLPELISRENNISTYPYYESYTLSKEQKAEDLIKVLALLHNKSSFSREITKDKYESIYDNMIGYVNYLSDFYSDELKKVEMVRYPSPSEILFITNYSKLLHLFEFLKDEIKNWFLSVKTKNKERVSYIHGNVSLDHLIVNDREYLISWGKSRIESPVMDIINFYHNEWDNIDFSSILNKYFDACTYTDEEKKLLFINLAIPLKYEKSNSEYKNVINMRKFFDYIYKTENLIRPYYSIENKEK